MGKDDNQGAHRSRRLPPQPHALPEHEILARVAEPLAEVLWRALRNVRQWAAAAPADRPKLFSEPGPEFQETLRYAARHAPELGHSIGVFGTLRTAPRLITTGDLVTACTAVYTWADAQALTDTAVLFAEAAASLDPDNPLLATEAGKATRRAALIDRADVWFDRAALLAAKRRNRREQIRALLGRGTLMRETGRYREARALLGRAAQIAASTRRHRQAAEASHDLLAIAVEDGTYEEAEMYVRAALRNYPIHHPSIPRFVHDWAFFLVRNALYEQALPLLLAIVPLAARPELTMLYWGSLGRAAAGAGRRDLYDDAARHVVALAGLHQEFAAAALANLAEGSRFFREWSRGQEFATHSIKIAVTRHEADVECGAREILTAIIERQVPVAQAPPPRASRIQAITRRIMALLEARKKPPRRPVQTDRDGGRGEDSPANPPTTPPEQST